MPEIGTTLREARMRQRIDISEVEAETKIRAKYLRALEDEEWNLLPGPAYVKSFLRTYADALGLDGRLLVEEYKLRHERLSDIEMQPIAPPRAGTRGRGRPPRRGISRWWAVAFVVAALIAALYALGRDANRTEQGAVVPQQTTAKQRSTATAAQARKRRAAAAARRRRAAAASQVVRLRVAPTGAVYACLVDASGRRLINGAILEAGQGSRTFRSRRFRVTLGNGNVRLVINGRSRSVPQTANGIAYEITKRRGRRTLGGAQRPACAG